MPTKPKRSDKFKLVDITEIVSDALDNAAKGRRAQKKTTNLRELAEKEITHVKRTKAGEYIPRKGKAGATHKIIDSGKASVLAAPLAKAPKPPKDPAAAYGAPRIPDEKPDSNGSWHPAIPSGATWLEYSTSQASILMPITEIESLKGFRGTIRFGKLRYHEDFVSMMPGEEGNVTRWKDGTTSFAEGKDPASLKKREESLKDAAERLKNPEAHVKAAFAANVAKRRVPPGPRPGDIAGKIQNGVRKPGAGGKTARVWEICDDLFSKLGRCPTKAEVLAITDKEKASPGMATINYSYWRRFHGRNPT